MALDDRILDSLEVCEQLQQYAVNQDASNKENAMDRAAIDRILNGEPDVNTAKKQQEATLAFVAPPELEATLEKTQDDTHPVAPLPTSKEDSVRMVSTVSVGSVEVEEGKEESSPHALLRWGISLAICVIIALGISFVITKFVAHHTTVVGSSMESTLSDGDQLIIEKVSYYIHEPERYDIIVFPYSKNVFYIKRIIGLPGESIQIVKGKILINGTQLDESYGKEVMVDPGLAADKITLAKDEYFVLGDNRNSSVDSRKADVGVIKRNKIEGKAWLRFYPFGSFGIIQHK